MIKDLEQKIKAYGLKNAIDYEGKAQAGSVLSSLFHEGLEKSEVKEVMPKINEILKQINSKSLEKQKEDLEELESFISHRKVRAEDELPELPNTEKGVVMRFCPSPSGPLHVGHIVSNMIQSLYTKKYKGTFYVRIEDTNPEKIVKEAYEQIKEDCNWIFGNVKEYIIQSDRMEIYYSYVRKLLEKNAVYVCTCSQEKFKEFSEKMKDCPCKKLKDQEKRWQTMLDKEGYKEGEAVLRFKTELGMKDPNPAMRDFPLARICLSEHPKQKHRYRVWPLMNLAVTTDDIELGMTHIIRGKDHRDNAKRQKMIYKVLGLESKYPWTAFIGRIKFNDINLSKRNITEKIESGEYEGWEDEKLPTVASLRKRNFKPEGFAKFAIQRGISEVDKVMDSKEFFSIVERFSKE